MTNKLVSIHIDIPATSELLQRERQQAVEGLLAYNRFTPILTTPVTGPFHLNISMYDRRLNLDIRTQQNEPIHTFLLSMKPYKDSIDFYLDAVTKFDQAQTLPREKMEVIDRLRRQYHDEAATTLMENLKNKIIIDHDTARNFFTLICALHMGNSRNVWMHPQNGREPA